MGWACSECALGFRPSGSPVGISLEEVKSTLNRGATVGLHLTSVLNTQERLTNKARAGNPEEPGLQCPYKPHYQADEHYGT